MYVTQTRGTLLERLTFNLKVIRDSSYNELDRWIDDFTNALEASFPQQCLHITRLNDKGQYQFEQSRNPFGAYWTTDLAEMILRDAGLSSYLIGRLFEA